MGAGARTEGQRGSCEAKSDPQLRGVADAVVQRTGVDADDVPEVSGALRPKTAWLRGGFASSL
jgi:hypothetical protein